MVRHVRLGTEADAADLSRLNQQFNGGEAVDPLIIKESICQSGEIVAVVTLEEQIVGFACAQSFRSFCYADAQGEITEMFVEESVRRMGLASLLIDFLEEKLLERGVKSIKIITGKHNKAALRTYVENGYALEDDLILEKNQ